MAAAAKKPKDSPRQALCREWLELERDNAVLFARIAEIKAALKLDAETSGKFRETIPNLGHVSISPGAPAHTIGEEPVLQVDAWQALEKKERNALLKAGLVKIAAIVKGAYYGRAEAILTVPLTTGAAK